MMKQLTFLLLTIPLKLFSQADTSQAPFFTVDTTWNHSILESDLILYVEIQQAIFVTQAGSFQGKVIEVIKGKFNDSNFQINLNLIEFSQTRWDKRLDAIFPGFDKMKFPYRCYAGFVKSNKYYDPIVDPKTKQKYYFFMSGKTLEKN